MSHISEAKTHLEQVLADIEMFGSTDGYLDFLNKNDHHAVTEFADLWFVLHQIRDVTKPNS